MEQEIINRIEKLEKELRDLKISYELHKHTRTDGTRGLDTSLRLSSSSLLSFGLVTVSSGLGSPQGSVVAYIGSVYLRSDGGATTTFYVKELNQGSSTGWIAK